METPQEALTRLPHAPGVYLFYDGAGHVIYVGKAIDLARRVRQYFQTDSALGLRTGLLVESVARIETRTTVSEFDALLLEATLIRRYRPKYNSIAKDDKSPIYVYIAVREELPHVALRRKSSLPDLATQKRERGTVIGPFLSAHVARDIMRALRHVSPYCTQKQRNGKPCFYTHLGLCRPCPSVIAKIEQGPQRAAFVKSYRRNVLRIRAILLGRSRAVIRTMETDMKRAARANNFEEAGDYKKRLLALRHLVGHAGNPIEFENAPGIRTGLGLTRLAALLKPFYSEFSYPHRIECIDISNLGGHQAAGSLTVLTDGKPDTNEYRRFRIRGSATPNDTAMIAEVVVRRLDHPEWPLPDLLVIDGGKGPVHAAQTILSERGVIIPVIGLAKRNEEIIVPVADAFQTLVIAYRDPALQILQTIRDEAHRFALLYHRKLRLGAWIDHAKHVV